MNEVGSRCLSARGVLCREVLALILNQAPMIVRFRYDLQRQSTCLKFSDGITVLKRHLIKKKRRLRRPLIESLERRDLLAASWRNPVNAYDVNNDQRVSPIDALVVINDLGRSGSRELVGAAPTSGRSFVDTTGDGAVSPLDALRVINQLNLGNAGPYVLGKSESVASHATVLIGIGEDVGIRTYRFHVDANFDRSDAGSTLEDTLAVYVIDPETGDTLIDRGAAGTAVFTLSGEDADYVPGQVRFNGEFVEIDISTNDLGEEALLRFQLINTDADSESRVTITPTSNTVDEDAIASPRFAPDVNYATFGGALDLSELQLTDTLLPEFENIRFDDMLGVFTATVRVRNVGERIGRQLAIEFSGLPDSVALLNASGATDSGSPYVNLRDAIPFGGLQRGATTDPVEIAISSPGGQRFSLSTHVLVGAANRAPVFEPVDTITVFPGDTRQLELIASDPDGDPVSFLLTPGESMPSMRFDSNGSVEFFPAPSETGTYTFNVSATDGALQTPRSVRVIVAEDTNQLTRISGRVLDTNELPLENIPVEIGRFHTSTLADGTFQFELPSFIVPTESFDIAIPTADSHFDPFASGDESLSFFRAGFNVTTGTSLGNPRQHPNLVSTFIDASTVYGSDESRANALRQLDGTGKLKVSTGDLLPFNREEFFPDGPLENENNSPNDPNGLFAAGDVRANENVALLSLHTLFVREHNRKADEIAQASPSLSGEELYLHARRWVSGLIQHITYSEFLPLLLGGNAIPSYEGYDSTVDPSISGLFSGAAFRFAHSTATSTLDRLDDAGETLPGGAISLREAFFNSTAIQQDGIEPYLRGMASQVLQELDTAVIDELRNFLFGPPGAGGMDLVSLNIQRGRDLGLPDYNQARRDVGLAPVTSLSQITSDVTVQNALASVYENVDEIDLWVGGLAEDHVPGAMVGELFWTIIRDQFLRLRDADRFWYENSQFVPSELTELRGESLSSLIVRNTTIDSLSDSVFSVQAVPSGPSEGGGPAGSDPTEFRTFDGSGNNAVNSLLGRTGTNLKSDYSQEYADGVNAPAGGERSGARAISNAVFAASGSQENSLGATNMFAIWGQLLTHDTNLTPGGTDDTLKIHGEMEPSDDVYPFIAEKLPLVLGHPVYVGVNNVVERPIYLPILDEANGTTIDPASDTMVMQELAGGGMASVEVSAGMLEDRTGNQFDGVLSITEVPRDLTPAALPNGLFPGAVVTIQPGEMVFETPAPLTLPNRSDLPPGTKMDLWSINPTSGEFEVVGTGEVSDDGTLIDTVEGGIRNSSWHFFAILADFLAAFGSAGGSGGDGSLADTAESRSGTDDCGCGSKATKTSKSEVELFSGAYLEDHALATYQSLGSLNGISLHYNSQWADPQPIIEFHLGQTPASIAQSSTVELYAKAVISNGQTSVTAPGNMSGNVPTGDYVFPVNDTALEGGFQLDFASTPTGVYQYGLETGIRMGDQGASIDLSGEIVNVNASGSQLGAGWSIGNEQRIVRNPDGSLLLVKGNGSTLVFPAVLGGGYESPIGDFSRIENVNGRIHRTMTNGTVYEFDGNDRLSIVRDRNGNRMIYRYDAEDRLNEIEDAVGLVTTFEYSSGLVAITDPANRVTSLSIDDLGNLVAIEDPDETRREFTYDNRHRMLSEINKRGHEERIEYDQNGRVSKIILPDGEVQVYSPVETQLLNGVTATGASASLGLPEVSLVVDQNGRIELQRLDTLGQTTSTIDGVGSLGQLTRNDDNLVTNAVTGSGRFTQFAYDESGNRTEIQDLYAREVAAAKGTAPNQFVLDANSRFKPLAGDFDNDGTSELIAFTDGGMSIVRFDSGQNTYSASLIDLGFKPQLTGDFNNDGLLDLLAPGDDIRVALNDGETGFVDVTPNARLPRENHASVNDVNGDGNLDLVVRGTLYLGDGEGHFVFESEFDENARFNDGFAMGDFNSDGYADVAYVMETENTIIRTFFGAPVGAFSTSSDRMIFSGRRVSGSPSIAPGDFNGDGFDDVAISIYDGDTFFVDRTYLMVYFGDAEGAFTIVDNLGSFNYDDKSLPLAAVDVNGDLIADLFVGRGKEVFQPRDSVDLYLGSAQHPLMLSDSFSVGRNPIGIEIEDFTGDGLVDLFTLNTRDFIPEHSPSEYGHVTLLVGIGAAKFLQPNTIIPFPEVDGMSESDSFSLGTTPELLFDANNDGLLDLLSNLDHPSNPVLRGFHLSLGQIDGTFGTAVKMPFSFSGGIYQPRAVDINGDGFLDLLTSHSDHIRVQLNNGLGQFEWSGERFESGLYPDLNQDGRHDIIRFRDTDNNRGVFIQYGESDGSFTDVVSYDVFALTNNTYELSFSPRFFSDVTGDGITDVVLSARRPGEFQDAFVVLVGIADGGFADDVVLSVTGTYSEAGGIELVDVDNDGQLDIVAGKDGAGFDLERVVFKGHGDGRFTVGAELPWREALQTHFDIHDEATDLSAISQITGDLNGDSLLDLVVTVEWNAPLFRNGLVSGFSEQRAKVALAGMPGGGFEFPYGFLDHHNSSVQLVDLTGDGLDDIVNVYPAGMHVITGTKDLVFSELGRFTIEGDFTALEVDGVITGRGFVDFNHDGFTDLVTGAPDGGLSVLYGPFSSDPFSSADSSAQASVGAPVKLGYDPVFNQLASVVDELGRRTLFEIDPLNGNTLSVTQVVGDESEVSSTPTSGNSVDAVFADIDGDTFADVVVANSGPNGSLRLLTGSQNGEFRIGPAIAEGDISSVTASDYDGDGNIDVAFTEDHPDGVRAFVALGDGTGDFMDPIQLQIPLTGIDKVPTINSADLDGDGRSELLIAHGFATIAMNDGSGGFTDFLQPEISGALPGFARHIVAAELDGQNGIDLVVATSAAIGREISGGRLYALLSNGAGGFTVSEIAETTGAPTGIAIGDLDGDGLSDIAVAGTVTEVSRGAGPTIETSGIWKFINSGDGRNFDSELLIETSRPSDVALADVDQDGDADLAFTLNDGRVVARLNDNATFSQRIEQHSPAGASSLAFAELDSTPGLDALVTSGDSSTLTIISNFIGGLGGGDDISTQFTYTSTGQVDTQTDPLGRVTDYDYDAFGRLERVTYAVGTADQAVQLFGYDSAGNMTSSQDENGNVITFEYDTLNRLKMITEPDPDGTGPLSPPVTTFDYDQSGNLASVTDAEQKSTTSVHDAMDRLILTRDAQSNETTFEYDRNGNLITTIDPLGNRTERIYDARNRVVKTVDPEGGETTFEYDLNNNLTQLTDPVGNSTQFVYDARDRLTTEIDPFGNQKNYQYDAVDSLIRSEDRNGRITQFEYDDLDRLDLETWLSADGRTVANEIDYDYDQNSNPLTITDSFSSLGFTYDSRDRVRSVDNTGTSNVPSVVLTYAYDGVGNVTSVIDSVSGSQAATTNYVYDALNRVEAITQFGNNVSDKRIDLSYNQLGQFTSIDRRSGLTVGDPRVALSSYQYDSLNRLDLLSHAGPSGNDLAFFDLEFDAASRITSIEDINGLSTYSYDDRSQLTGADRDDADSRGDESYRYDENGNRLASHVHGNGYQTDTNNRLISDGTYSYDYDNEGNMVLRTAADGSTRSFEFDHRNRLVAVSDKDASGTQVQLVEFAYDSFGRRITKAVTDAAGSTKATNFVYDGPDVVLDFVGDTLVTRYLHGPATDQVLAQESNSEVLWHLADHLGTTHDLVDSTGQVVQHFQFDSFGQLLSVESPLTRYLFTGREYDDELELYYYRARYYDASIGQFTSEDPIGFAALDSNLHRYVGNDPLHRTDPSGNYAKLFFDLLLLDTFASGVRFVYNALTPGEASTLLLVGRLEQQTLPKAIRDESAALGALQSLLDHPICMNGEMHDQVNQTIRETRERLKALKQRNDKVNNLVQNLVIAGARELL